MFGAPVAELDSTNILQTIKQYSQEKDAALGDVFVGMDKKKLGSVTIQEFIQGLQVKFKCYMLCSTKLKGHGHDFSQILFFRFPYIAYNSTTDLTFHFVIRNAFLNIVINKWKKKKNLTKNRDHDPFF